MHVVLSMENRLILQSLQLILNIGANRRKNKALPESYLSIIEHVLLLNNSFQHCDIDGTPI